MWLALEKRTLTMRPKYQDALGHFLEHSTKQAPFSSTRLESYQKTLDELEAEFGADATEDRLRAAESLVSDNATEIFQMLPVVEPFEKSRIVFDAKKPAKLTLFETLQSGATTSQPT